MSYQELMAFKVDGIIVIPFCVVVRPCASLKLINHEVIHFWQQIECFIIMWYVLYVLNYLWNRLFKKMSNYFSYINVCFEKEAYANEDNFSYVCNRKMFSWSKYL